MKAMIIDDDAEFINQLKTYLNQTFKNVIRIITFKVHCEKHFIKIL